jgi:hypothetical protein
MPDHEVRLRMHRGRTPQARLELANWHHITADQEFQERMRMIEHVAARREAGKVVLYGRGIPTRETLEAPKRSFDEYQFQIAVLNTGELTIRDFVLAVRIVTQNEKLEFVGDQLPKIGTESRFRFQQAEFAAVGHLPERKLFPGDRVFFPAQTWSLSVTAGSNLLADSLVLEWTIFLDDTAPNRGALDLAVVFHGAAQANAGE